MTYLELFNQAEAANRATPKPGTVAALDAQIRQLEAEMRKAGSTLRAIHRPGGIEFVRD